MRLVDCGRRRLSLVPRWRPSSPPVWYAGLRARSARWAICSHLPRAWQTWRAPPWRTSSPLAAATAARAAILRDCVWWRGRVWWRSPASWGANDVDGATMIGAEAFWLEDVGC